jgi:hypothetical protein
VQWIVQRRNRVCLKNGSSRFFSFCSIGLNGFTYELPGAVAAALIICCERRHAAQADSAVGLILCFRRRSRHRCRHWHDRESSDQLPWCFPLGIGCPTGRLFLRQPVGPIDRLDEALQHLDRDHVRCAIRPRAGVVATPEENGRQRRRLSVLVTGKVKYL